MRSITFVRLLLVFNFLYPFFERYFHLPYVSRLYVNMVILLFWLLSMLTQNPKTVPEASGLRVLALVLLFLIGLSALVNSSDWFVTAKTIVESYLPYIILFFIVVSMRFRRNEQPRLVELCFALIILQFPVALAQFFLGGYSTLDSNSGTISRAELGGTDINVVLASFVLIRCVLKLLTDRVRARHILLAVATMVPMVCGGAKFGFIIIPVALIASIFSLSALKWKMPTKRLLGMLSVILLFAALFYVLVGYLIPRSAALQGGLNLDVLLNPDSFVKYDKGVGAGRIVAFGALWKQVSPYSSKIALGLGSQAVGESKLGRVSSPWLGSVYEPISSDITFFANLGVLGLAFLTFTFVYAIAVVRKYLRREPSAALRLDAAAFIPISVVCIVSCLYTSVWISQIGLVYWILFGVLVRRFHDLAAPHDLAASAPIEPVKAGYGVS